MGVLKQVPEIVDTGVAPEFFITHVPKVEMITDSDCLRLYVCANREHGAMMLQYTAIIPRHRLVLMLKEIDAACQIHPALLAFVPDAPPS